ncbi:MAG: DUF1761 domain-containing protein [Euryarchaeota archaeon]|nr:DUF1761 domain-containing protein [Euryarchaeota archaeon]
MFHADLNLNWLAIIAAGAVYFVLGAVWYSPAVFGKKWMELVGMTEEKAKEGGQAGPLVGMFLLNLIAALALAALLAWSDTTGLTESLIFSLFIAIGFVITTELTHVLFEKTETELFMINAGYHVVGIVLMGLVIGAWS